jgi:hypothetical protein
MTNKAIWVAAVWLLALPSVALTSDVITMDQEPHHHLALQNDYVKVFDVHVSPGDSIVLHRHDRDTVAIAIGDQDVTVGIPGKLDVRQKNADAQVRLQRGGYVHSTRVDGDVPYHTVAVELLHPQTNFHNICAVVLPGLPMNCSDGPAMNFWVHPAGGPQPVAYYSQPLTESNETHVRQVRVAPHISLVISDIPFERSVSRLVVALDAVSISSGSRIGPEKSLQPGDFFWIEGSPGVACVIENRGDKEARVLDIIFPLGQ